jgi:hypothetical protein
MNKWNKIKKKSLGEIPQIASTNLQVPEFAPGEKGKKSLVLTERTKAMGLKAREEFYWQVKELALRERCLVVEVLEKAFDCYKREKVKGQIWT